MSIYLYLYIMSYFFFYWYYAFAKKFSFYLKKLVNFVLCNKIKIFYFLSFLFFKHNI